MLKILTMTIAQTTLLEVVGWIALTNLCVKKLNDSIKNDTYPAQSKAILEIGSQFNNDISLKTLNKKIKNLARRKKSELKLEII